ncbi:MAG: hypothetical protein HY010_13235 [Acidobacteria bacterium]|nr:hypothetical protein [Acidobacteriota bacterium]
MKSKSNGFNGVAMRQTTDRSIFDLRIRRFEVETRLARVSQAEKRRGKPRL